MGWKTNWKVMDVSTVNTDSLRTDSTSCSREKDGHKKNCKDRTGSVHNHGKWRKRRERGQPMMT